MSYGHISDRFVIARKQHQCSWCGEKIEKKEHHYSRTFTWEGDLQHDHMHVECEKAMRNTPREDLVDGWEPGTFERPPKESS